MFSPVNSSFKNFDTIILVVCLVLSFRFEVAIKMVLAYITFVLFTTRIIYQDVYT